MADPTQRLVRGVNGMPTERGRRELAQFLRRLAWLVALIVALIAWGTVALSVAEGVSLWHGFVWSLDTVATVGSIAAPADAWGEAIKVVLIVLGVGTLLYALVTVTEFFVAGHLSGMLEERRLQNMLNALTDHYLICGYGRVGRQVARDLEAADASYVVIDNNPETIELAREEGVTFLEGSASEDEVLRAAGIDRARAVIACLDSDAENIFITLTARELCPSVTIVARASVEDSEKKLRRAGADRVISPYKASGTEMARLALHPQVSGVVDVAPEYRLEEIEIMPGSRGVGKTIADVRGGAVIAALRRRDGHVVPQPPAESVLEPGDVVIAMGTPRTLIRLEDLFAPATEAQAS
jgi:voltage-gated potassium channel